MTLKQDSAKIKPGVCFHESDIFKQPKKVKNKKKSQKWWVWLQTNRFVLTTFVLLNMFCFILCCVKVEKELYFDPNVEYQYIVCCIKQTLGIENKKRSNLFKYIPRKKNINSLGIKYAKKIELNIHVLVRDSKEMAWTSEWYFFFCFISMIFLLCFICRYLG